MTPSNLPRSSGLPKLRRPKPRREATRLRSTRRIVLGDHQRHAPVSVGEEQVLGVGAWYGLAQSPRLLDREHRFVLHRDGGDAELFQPREEFPPVGRHRGGSRFARPGQRFAGQGLDPGVILLSAKRLKLVLWTSEGGSTTTPDSAFKREPDGFGKSARVGRDRGCSSGVEHNLAKVGVVGSNPIARSNFLPRMRIALSTHSRGVRGPWREAGHARLPPARQSRALTVGIALSGEGHFTFGPQIETPTPWLKTTNSSRD